MNADHAVCIDAASVHVRGTNIEVGEQQGDSE